MPAAIQPLGILLGVVFMSTVAGTLGWLFGLQPAPGAKRAYGNPCKRNRIVVPLSDSPTSRQALNRAFELALERRAEIVLANVIVIPMTLGLDVPLDDLEEHGRRILADGEMLARQHGLCVESRLIRHRSTLGALKDLARETGAETIVLGATPPRWWLSSGIGRSVSRQMLGEYCEVIVAKPFSR
jgi:nucleotide-binding universal stress UspA family protein